MIKYVISAYCALILSLGTIAQQTVIDGVLQSIEVNNPGLKAYDAYLQTQALANKAENNVANPQAVGYYLPFGEHMGSDYMEFQISQTIEFPSVYASRHKLNVERDEGLKIEYSKLRQEVLLKAQSLLYELIYLQQQKQFAEKRMVQGDTILQQTQTLYDKGQIGILELNKAKVAWLQSQFAVEEIETERQAIQMALQGMNGGNTLSFEGSSYPTSLHLPSVDSIWQQRLYSDAELLVLQKDREVAEQNIKLEKNKVLPDLSAGYNYQGVAGSNYSGIYAGLSIPLWGNRAKVKTAKAELQQHEQQAQARTFEIENQFRTDYQRYELLLKKFTEYEQSLDGLNSEALLLKSYELGEIAFLDYFREVQFYREAIDTKLSIEKEMYQLRAKLFKHQL
ncbi:TolC family protein [Owenweeksia hongkongensis]|uniref:TolC family protein n=1 Tax=Owenweeksia hongkongensis TaxID=253245 RepID=UPI003A9320AB